MNEWLLMCLVKFVFVAGVGRNWSSLYYPDFFVTSVFCANIEILNSPVAAGLNVSANYSHPGLDGFITLSSDQRQWADVGYEVINKSNDHVVQEEAERRLVNCRVEYVQPSKRARTSSVFKSNLNSKTINNYKNFMRKIRPDYVLAEINILNPFTARQGSHPRSFARLRSSTRQKRREVSKHPEHSDGRNSFPLKKLWSAQPSSGLEASSSLSKRYGKGGFLKGDNLEVKKRMEEHVDLAVVPWQTLWLLQSERAECSYKDKVLQRYGATLLDLEDHEWLRPSPEESLGNCPVRFRPLVDPYRWLPRNLVEAECVCEGSPCSLRGLHVCVTVYASRTVYSLRTGKRRILIAVGCLCAIQKMRLAAAITPKTVD